MAEPDLSEFVTLSKPRRLGCSVAIALEQLEKKEREQLQAALLAGASITHSAIAGWLTKRGKKVSQHTISRHRRGACSCDG